MGPPPEPIKQKAIKKKKKKIIFKPISKQNNENPPILNLLAIEQQALDYKLEAFNESKDLESDTDLQRATSQIMNLS